MPFLGTTGGGSVKQYGGQANLGYFIKNSLRFRDSASGYLNRTPATAGNRTTWTWSGWVKRGTVSPRVSLFGFGTTAGSGQPSGAVYFDSNTIYVVSGGGISTFVSTTPVYRDPSAWYHIVIAFDSTQATASNRVKIYVNGLQVTSLANTTYPSQNYNSDYNNTVAQYIGARGEGGLDSYFHGYMTEINSVDGQQLTPSSFGKTDAATGQWIPKKFEGTYGTNGFYLKFADASAATAAAIGKDSSPNGNNWTPNNISVTAGVTYDAMIDSPTLSGAASNYCTLNPLNSTSGTLYDANLRVYQGNPSAFAPAYSTFAVSSGKWYWECAFSGINSASGYDAFVGIALSTFTPASANYPGGATGSYGYYSANGEKIVNGTFSAYGATWVDGNIISVALDLDTGTLTFYKNNVSQGTAATGISGTFYMAASSKGAGAYVNFGQRPFAYTPPTGFKSLNAFNLP